MFNDYFNVENGSYNVFHDINIDDIKETDNYIYHEITQYDNLMNISYKYYNTINNWWILFLFNNLNDVNFSFINDTMINRTIEYFNNLLNNYDSLDIKTKAILKGHVIDYYNINNNLKNSIFLANLILDNINSDFITEFNEYIVNDIITNSLYLTKLKIPSDNVVFAIKNRLDALSLEWKINN